MLSVSGLVSVYDSLEVRLVACMSQLSGMPLASSVTTLEEICSPSCNLSFLSRLTQLQRT